MVSSDGMDFAHVFVSVYHVLGMSMAIQDYRCTVYIYPNHLSLFTSCVMVTVGL